MRPNLAHLIEHMPAYADPAAVDALRSSWQPLIRALDDRLAATSKQLAARIMDRSPPAR